MNNREVKNQHGLFWRQDNDQRQLWGTLRINEINEATLETFGSLINTEERSPVNIIGQINPGYTRLTLINCLPTNTTNQSPVQEGQIDWSHQTCFVNQVVDGIAFEGGAEVTFEEAILDISTLSKWVNPGLVQTNLTKGTINPYRIEVSVRERADETAIVNFRGEDIKVSIRFIPKEGPSFKGVISRYSVEDHSRLAIEKPDGARISLENIIAVIGAILNLLAICCNETPTVDEFEVLYDKEELFSTKVFVRMRGYNSEKREGFPYPFPSFNDIGGTQGIAKWLQVSEAYGPPVGLLTSNWFNERAYNEDKFARVYTAVEGLVSRRKERGKARMNVQELADFVGGMVPQFLTLANSAALAWAQKVKGIRDQRISHSDPASTAVADGRGMVMMTNLLYVAGAAFLLREIGMENQHIEKYIEGCYQSLLLSEQQ